MSEDTPNPQEVEAPLSIKRQLLAVVVVLALSTLGALVLSVIQQRALGDQPLAMLVFGCLLAFVSSGLRNGNPILLGPAAMAGFPVCALGDMLLSGGHNLFPFELAFYAAYTVLGVFVATVGFLLRWPIARLCRRFL